MQAQLISLSDVIIPKLFIKSMPTRKHINKCIRFYNKHKEFDKPILINENNILHDNYSRYMAALEIGLKNIYCCYVKPIYKKEIRQIVFDKCKGRCAICGEPIQNDDCTDKNTYMTIDHVIPKSRGGLDDVENYQGACRKCNGDKGNKI